MQTLKQVLMQRDGMTEEEAREEIQDALEELNMRLDNQEDIQDFCEERWGLEPDYLEELLFGTALD